jgi:Tfp pilus assembly protein PilO
MSKLSTHQKWLLVILAVILINFAVWYFGLSPALEKVKAARKEFSTVEQQKISLQKRLGELNAIDAPVLQQEMDLMNVQVPELGYLREFLVYIEETAAKLGVELGNISIAEPREAGSYLSLDFSLSINGTYAQLYSFLKTFEQNERLLLVHSFNLSGEEKMSSSIQFTIYAEDFDQYTPHKAPGRENPFKDY